MNAFIALNGSEAVPLHNNKIFFAFPLRIIFKSSNPGIAFQSFFKRVYQLNYEPKFSSSHCSFC